MSTRLIASAVLAAAVVAGCGESDPYKVNNSVTTGKPPDPGFTPSGGGGTSEMTKKAGAYPMPKGMTRPGQAAEATDPAKAEEAPAKAEEAPAEPKAGEAAAPDAKPAETGLSEENLKEIAKLAPEDQELAKAQGVCLISGEPLGSMGMPVRVEHEGTVGFLCCKGCQADFDKDPATAIAKVKK